ncbi:MAG: 50S ribosomal protein L13 [Acidobacteria bacterium]|nr:50S ribosomal protein L13 [Acidobacteriota bacterium]
MKTYVPDGERLREGRKWYMVDADGQVLGRLASRVARILMGKHKSQYTPFLDGGDFVIVVNAEKVRLTGNKGKGKVYRRHTGYPGGLKEVRAEDYLRKHPDRMVAEAVVGMLPKTKLGRAMFRKLKVYKGSQHPHVAQRPQALVL